MASRGVYRMAGGINASGLAKSFYIKGLNPFSRKEILALAHVSFTVGEGEAFGITGENGAGKTTLMRILATLITPTSGEAFVGGRSVLSDGAEVRRRTGVVLSDERSFFWRLTGRQNLEFYASLHGLHGREGRLRVSEACSSLGIEAFADRRFEGYSTGMRQATLVARALLHRPDVLLLDEPTKGLDAGHSESVVSILKKFLSGGGSILLSSHDTGLISALCSRSGQLREGRLEV
jgi:ABC-type multidrug transport system ATPase subunit